MTNSDVRLDSFVGIQESSLGELLLEVPDVPSQRRADVVATATRPREPFSDELLDAASFQVKSGATLRERSERRFPGRFCARLFARRLRL